MQGKLGIAILLAAFGSTGAIAGESIRKIACPRAEQPAVQQRQQVPQAQQQRPRASQGCPVSKTIPPVVDPTPVFLL